MLKSSHTKKQRWVLIFNTDSVFTIVALAWWTVLHLICWWHWPIYLECCFTHSLNKKRFTVNSGRSCWFLCAFPWVPSQVNKVKTNTTWCCKEIKRVNIYFCRNFPKHQFLSACSVWVLYYMASSVCMQDECAMNPTLSLATWVCKMMLSYMSLLWISRSVQQENSVLNRVRAWGARLHPPKDISSNPRVFFSV